MKISTIFSKAIALLSLLTIVQISTVSASDFSVKFERVKADQVGETVVVRWVTTTEINNEYFKVQRSVNGGSLWEVIGSVESTGNTPGGDYYNFIDENPVEGLIYYRIQQNDFDGTYDYSFKATVEFTMFTDDNDTEVQVYPNPTEEGFTIETTSSGFSETVSIEMMDISGKLIAVNTDVNDSQIVVRPINKLTGLYFLMITDRNKKIVKKVKFK